MSLQENAIRAKMKHGALLIVMFGLSGVHCLPRIDSPEVKGRQVAAVTNAVTSTVDTVAAALPAVAANVAANVNVNTTRSVSPFEDAEGVKGAADHLPYIPIVQLNLLSAIGHIVSPLIKGVLEPLLMNIALACVGAIVKTIAHPEVDLSKPHYDEHDGPSKFPSYRSEAETTAGAVVSSLFSGFDAYVMRVPGAGKYLFISSDRNLKPGASASSEAGSDKNLAPTEGYEEIPFSANPILNSIFGNIRVRSGPIPDKKVENYVRQQLGVAAAPANAA
nr:PREDICTED: uncharacterized protein LOC109032223 isoform X1 [Bemisia tabaci]